MLITLSSTVILSNAMTTKKNISIGYPRLGILVLVSVIYVTYYNTNMKCLEEGIGLYNGLFNISTLSQCFNGFIFAISSIILLLSGVFPRKIYNKLNEQLHNSVNTSQTLTNEKNLRKNKFNIKIIELLLNKSITQFTIIEYTLVITFIVLGAALLMSTGDLVSLFLSIELQSYGLYILATLYRDSESATGSGLTYFLLGGLSSCFILFGSSILYINSGSTNLDNIYIINSISEVFDNNVIYNSDYINLSLIILCVGFLFKVSSAPFHFWSPDVYDGIPTHVTTFVAIIAKISLFIVLLEISSNTSINDNNNFGIIGNTTEWKDILILSSLLSLVIGSTLGITQHRIKRLLAYSTISHVGFILIALSVNKVQSIQGYIFYILQYSICNLNVFFILILIGYSVYGNIVKSNDKFIDKENSPIQLIEQIRGYFYRNSYLAISFTITLFSFIGIPPLIGFFAKQMVLSAALDDGYIFLTLVAIVTSVIGAAYYLNLVKLLFFYNSDTTNNFLLNNESKSIITYYYNKTYLNNYLSIVVSILTTLITLFIFTPEEWYRVVHILGISSFNL